MNINKSNSRILLAGCLALTVLSVTAMTWSQSSASATVHPAAAASMQTRSDFASRIENQLRLDGADARVQLDGDSRDCLHVEWAQLGRRDVYSFVNSLSARQAKQLGFSAFVFSNGKQQWNYDLAKESMIWSPAQP